MDEIYQQNVRIVYHFLYTMCKNETLAEELTQETFLRAFQRMDRYDGTCKLSTWLCQIAKHLLYQTWEKRKREIPVNWEEEMACGQGNSVENTEQHVMQKIELEDVLKDLQTLPMAMREVIYLRALADLSYKEIGQIMGKSENWVRVNFYRGKEMLLKRRMQDEGM